MLQVRKSEERGVGDHSWLQSRHSFSFAGYYDPKHMGFRSLRVINEDRIIGGSGFGDHSHRNMEIISYVISGALEHKDSMGHQTVIHPGEVQKMSAGTGVVHSEFNQSKEDMAHFLQIWIVPDQKETEPHYGQKSFAAELEEQPLVLALSKDGRSGSIKILQDADIYLSRLNEGQELKIKVRPNRGVWIQMIKGSIDVNGIELKSSDGASTTNESELTIMAKQKSEWILFDLA